MDWKDYLAFLLGTIAVVSLMRAPAEGSPMARMAEDGRAFAADLLRAEGHACADPMLVDLELREDDGAVRFVACGGRGFALRLPADRSEAEAWPCDEGAFHRYPVGCSAAGRGATRPGASAPSPLRRFVGLSR